MTLQEIKNQMREEDKVLIDTVYKMYRDLLFGIEDEPHELGIYFSEIQAKYGTKFIEKILTSDEYKALVMGIK